MKSNGKRGKPNEKKTKNKKISKKKKHGENFQKSHSKIVKDEE